MATSYILLLFFVLNGADGTHIVGGRDSVPQSRPYMASLQVQGSQNCGGALVRQDFVLTAAHCQIPIQGPGMLSLTKNEGTKMFTLVKYHTSYKSLQDTATNVENDLCQGRLLALKSYLASSHHSIVISRPYTVVLGADSLTANEPTKQEFSAIRSIPHPNYDGHANDIMLLKLDRSAELTEAVQLIPLKTSRLKTSSRCITAGWGDVNGNGTLAMRLQEVNVTTLPQQTCSRRWGMVPITRTMVCGVGARSFQGFCSGDSGGPLVCDGAAAGVVSFSGQLCGNPRTPDVYTRVSSFREWITSVLNNN